MNVLVIGAGNMGYTYAMGLTQSALLEGKKVLIYDTDAQKREDLAKNSRFLVFSELEECLPKSHVILLAVKPYHAEALFKQMKPLVTNQQIIVSLMAGVTIAQVQEQLAINKVVRTMPNLPAKVGKGVTSYTASSDVSKVELITLKKLLESTGKAVYVSSEQLIDASTGISGSGPAYVFYFMQSMLEAAQKLGFSEEDARTLVVHTFDGAVTLFNESDLSPKKWMDKVASKGGTTQAALESMEDNNVKELIKQAAFAAFKRATEIGASG